MKIRLEIEGKNEASLSYKGPESAEAAVAYLNSIEADEVSIRLVKDDGTRANAEFSGKAPAVSAAKFITAVARDKVEQTSISAIDDKPLTLKERLEMFLRFEFPGAWFSSLDVKRRYESVYGKINLSTVSTYLARMQRNNLLERRGNRNQREYRLKGESPFSMEQALAK